MERIAAVASVIALGASILAYSVIHLGFPAVGFEAAGYLAALAFWVGVIAAGLAALVCFERWLKKRSRLLWPFVCAVIAVVVLAVTVRA